MILICNISPLDRTRSSTNARGLERRQPFVDDGAVGASRSPDPSGREPPRRRMRGDGPTDHGDLYYV